MTSHKSEENDKKVSQSVVMTRLILIFGFFFILFIHENQSYVPNPYFYGVRIDPLIGNGNKDNSKYHWKIEFRCPDSGKTLKNFY